MRRLPVAVLGVAAAVSVAAVLVLPDDAKEDGTMQAPPSPVVTLAPAVVGGAGAADVYVGPVTRPGPDDVVLLVPPRH